MRFGFRRETMNKSTKKLDRWSMRYEYLTWVRRTAAAYLLRVCSQRKPMRLQAKVGCVRGCVSGSSRAVCPRPVRGGRQRRDGKGRTVEDRIGDVASSPSSVGRATFYRFRQVDVANRSVHHSASSCHWSRRSVNEATRPLSPRRILDSFLHQKSINHRLSSVS